MRIHECTQPTRSPCPRCGKKGIGPWHANLEYRVRDRDCRYCNYTEMETFVIDDYSYHGQWYETDADNLRMTEYNGKSA